MPVHEQLALPPLNPDYVGSSAFMIAQVGQESRRGTACGNRAQPPPCDLSSCTQMHLERVKQSPRAHTLAVLGVFNAQELAALGKARAEGAPAITIVGSIPQSRWWANVDIEVPFAEVNELLGVQLDRLVVAEPQNFRDNLD